jgi:hypothetical protein
MPHQAEAVSLLRPGRILYGNVGTGKSFTALAWYRETYDRQTPLIVITTAKKRDSLEWVEEGLRLGVYLEGTSTTPKTQPENPQSLTGTLKVDSWNNIAKYEETEGAVFIFDEQRLVGTGAWVKSFLKIARKNDWIMLTGTPGDVWLDYAPVFVANGWYNNITDFKRQHVIYEPFLKFPKVKRYVNEEKLEKLRNEILVEMPYLMHTIRHLNWIDVGYDKAAVAEAMKTRWNPYTDEPMTDVAELWRVMRQIVRTDPSRLEMVLKLMRCHERLIVFYNYNYELRLLRTLAEGIEIGEWNGQRKTSIPNSTRWLYLVQYTAGSEGWNCTSTNAMILYSLPYSYKAFIQSQGRIDRLNTPYTDLYYYILKSSALVDSAVQRALERKESFNERKELRRLEGSHLLSSRPGK